MKRTITVIISMIAIALFSSSAFAKVTRLTENELNDVVAQAGISFSAEDTLNLSTKVNTLAFGDNDGAGENSSGAWLSFNNIDIQGSVEFHNPVKIAMTTARNESGELITGMDLQIDGLTVNMDSMRIDSITLGSNPGEGKSFGSFAMSGMRTTITGKVRIWTE